MMLNKSTVVSPIGEDGIFQPNSEPYNLHMKRMNRPMVVTGLFNNAFLERYETYSVGMDDYTII
jgi:hypothetical protein